MRKKVVIASAAIEVTICVAVGLMLRSPGDPSTTREGDAFGAADGSYEIGIPTAHVNDDVWYFAPAITNHSSKKLALEDVRPGTLPDGISFVEARLFDKEAFTAGVPMSWDTSGGSAADDPSSKPSTEVRGYTLLPGQTLPGEKIVYLHIRVTTTKRPLMSDGVTFIYQQSGKRYLQTLEANLTIAPASPKR